MISKELLSKVLGYEVKEVLGMLENSANKTILSYIFEDASLNEGKRIINIYELAHKCKVWATDNKYTILTENMHPNGYFAYVLSNKESIENYGYLKAIKDIPHNKTEPEAIFKATSYIMEQLKQKD